MALYDRCIKHGDVPHTSAGKCMECAREAEANALKEWEKKPLEEKLRDLYIRLKKLEKSESGGGSLLVEF